MAPRRVFNALLVPDKLQTVNFFPLPLPCPRKLKINFNFLMEGYGCFVWLRGGEMNNYCLVELQISGRVFEDSEATQ